MTGEEKINKIIEVINLGHTVYFSTPLRVYPVNKKTLGKFEKSGHDLFEGRGDHIYMRNGNEMLCMTGCKITYE